MRTQKLLREESALWSRKMRNCEAGLSPKCRKVSDTEVSIIVGSFWLDGLQLTIHWAWQGCVVVFIRSYCRWFGNGSSFLVHLYFLLFLFLYFFFYPHQGHFFIAFRERGRGTKREKEGERETERDRDRERQREWKKERGKSMWEKYWLVASPPHPNQGPTCNLDKCPELIYGNKSWDQTHDFGLQDSAPTKWSG